MSDRWDLIRLRTQRLEVLEGAPSGAVDTHEPSIFIHGTPDDEPIGEPRWHGCIRMRNEDVIELFDHLEIGTLVRIEE